MRCGEPAENAEKITALLQGRGNPAYIDAVAVKVSMVMRLFGEWNLAENAQKVKSHLSTAKPFEMLQKLGQYAPL